MSPNWSLAPEVFPHEEARDLRTVLSDTAPCSAALWSRKFRRPVRAPRPLATIAWHLGAEPRSADRMIPPAPVVVLLRNTPPSNWRRSRTRPRHEDDPRPPGSGAFLLWASIRWPIADGSASRTPAAPTRAAPACLAPSGHTSPAGMIPACGPRSLPSQYSGGGGLRYLSEGRWVGAAYV